MRIIKFQIGVSIGPWAPIFVTHVIEDDDKRTKRPILPYKNMGDRNNNRTVQRLFNAVSRDKRTKFIAKETAT